MAQLGIQGIVDEVEIGRGGFGVVYRGMQSDLGRMVAVKVLPAQLDQRARDRFDRERRAMGSLSGHPNIVTVHSTGFTDDGRPYIVMEYLARGSMDDRLRRDGPVRWDEAADLGAALADAVQAAHDAGILHRDIKPANVLVSDRGEPKLGDFGIARLEGAPETASSVITASIAHAAPEILDGTRPDEVADVYSLASTLYELMAGSPAFWRDTDESLVPMMARIAREDVPDLRDRGVPDRVATVIESAMSKDPAQRPATAGAFGESLGAALAEASEAGRRGAGGPSGHTMVVSAPPPPRTGEHPAAHPSPPPGTPAPPAGAPSASPPPGTPSPPPGAPGATPRPDVTPPGPPRGATTPPPGSPPPSGPPIAAGTGPSPAAGTNRRNLLVAGGVVAAVVVIVVVALLVAGGGGGGDDDRAEGGGSAPDAPTLPTTTGDDYPAYATSLDGSGAITVSAPTAWDDVDLGLDAPTQAIIALSTDVNRALTEFDTPGALIQVQPAPLLDADALLDDVVDPTGCTSLGRGDYADPLYEGRFEHLVDCGDVDATIWVVVAAPEDDAFTVVVSIQALGARDEAAARRILDSFVVEPRAVPGA